MLPDLVDLSRAVDFVSGFHPLLSTRRDDEGKVVENSA
jgi:hypothetical protein